MCAEMTAPKSEGFLFFIYCVACYASCCMCFCGFEDCIQKKIEDCTGNHCLSDCVKEHCYEEDEDHKEIIPSVKEMRITSVSPPAENSQTRHT